MTLVVFRYILSYESRYNMVGKFTLRQGGEFLYVKIVDWLNEEAERFFLFG